MKEINNEELENVNGGGGSSGHMVTCPNCNKKFNGDTNQVDYGDGCEKDVYYKCPYCEYEWR